MDLEVLYHEGPCLVINKPGGLLTQAPPGVDSAEVRAKAYFRAREGKEEGNLYLGVPHRLDRPVSGALVLARHARAANRLSEQFSERRVGKIYWAIVAGQVSAAEGTWRDHVRKIPEEPRAEVCSADLADAREAVLHYRVLGELEGGTWLEVQLETGRMHQVRVQGASRGHAIWGDELYGSQVSFGPAAADPRERWIALHARQLRFKHPMTKAAVEVVAPLPGCWPGLPEPAASENLPSS